MRQIVPEIVVNPDEMSFLAQEVLKTLLNKQHLLTSTKQKSVMVRKLSFSNTDLESHRKKQ
jgi:hypothetical protein